jgi:hypothetical protein
MDFSKWFHDTFEITEEMQTEDRWITLRQMIHPYIIYCSSFYKTKMEHNKNTTHQKFKNQLKQYEPEVYKMCINQIQKDNVKYRNVFCQLRRKCNRCDNTGYDESGNCLICNIHFH